MFIPDSRVNSFFQGILVCISWCIGVCTLFLFLRAGQFWSAVLKNLKFKYSSDSNEHPCTAYICFFWTDANPSLVACSTREYVQLFQEMILLTCKRLEKKIKKIGPGHLQNLINHPIVSATSRSLKSSLSFNQITVVAFQPAHLSQGCFLPKNIKMENVF